MFISSSSISLGPIFFFFFSPSSPSLSSLSLSRILFLCSSAFFLHLYFIHLEVGVWVFLWSVRSNRSRWSLVYWKVIEAHVFTGRGLGVMKRGKEEEEKKKLEPMFPRLHVNDADKGGGPRAPPRNKMALYEHLTTPSHRFTDHSSSPRHTNTLFPPPPGPSNQVLLSF